MEQTELLQHLIQRDIDLRPFFRELYKENFPDRAIIDEEAYHYALCKYKIGVIRNNQGIILNYYIYEQLKEHDSGESKKESLEHSQSESELPVGSTGTHQEEG